MTFLNPTHSPARSLGAGAYLVLAALGRMLAGLGDSYRRYRVYQDTCDSLQQLSDLELADMGIRRFEINSVACRAAFSES